ncbi:MAG: nicotinate-nicotinamide nucleotide adenylyltransferase [Parcubacteria group bacterium]|nr:nicotinate-nicotinamide nucleotide adenylyltransferase [Parcubacteria group bacterium]
MNSKKKIVIYGGSFNPPHLGHASAIEMAQRLFPCDEIWVMPSGNRQDKTIGVSGNHRKQMIEIMLNELFPNPGIPIKISTLELDRPKLTTTYETKNELERGYPAYEFHFLMGSDIFGEVEKRWVNGKKLYAAANFLVIQKPEAKLPDDLPKRVTVLDHSIAWLMISSTFIRKLIARGHSGIPYIATGVAEYIKKHKLYH